MSIEKTRTGFRYTVEAVSKRTGKVIDRFDVHNLMPAEGMDHFLNVLLNAGTQVSNWYILPFGNDYAPQPTDTAATFPALAGELTNYSSPTRIQLLSSPAAGGVSSNAANRAEFEFTSATTVRGAAIISTPTKGAAAGILLSAARFPSPKTADGDTILRVLAGIQLISA